MILLFLAFFSSVQGTHEPVSASSGFSPEYMQLLERLNCHIEGRRGQYTVQVPPINGKEERKTFPLKVPEACSELTVRNSLMALPVDFLKSRLDHEKHNRLEYWYSKVVWGQRLVRGAGLIAALILLLADHDITNAFRVEIFLGMFSTLVNIGIKRMESLQKGIIEERQKIDGRLSELVSQYDQFPELKNGFKALVMVFFGYETRDVWIEKLPKTYSAAGIKMTESHEDAGIDVDTRSSQNPYSVVVAQNQVSFSHRSPYAFDFSSSEIKAKALEILGVFEQHDGYRNSKRFYKGLIHRIDMAENFVDLMGVVVGGVAYLMHNYFTSLMITMGAHLFCLVTELLNSVVFEGRLEKAIHFRGKTDALCCKILAGCQPSVREELFPVVSAVTRYPLETMRHKLPLTARCAEVGS